MSEDEIPEHVPTRIRRNRLAINSTEFQICRPRSIQIRNPTDGNVTSKNIHYIEDGVFEMVL